MYRDELPLKEGQRLRDLYLTWFWLRAAIIISRRIMKGNGAGHVSYVIGLPTLTGTMTLLLISPR